ncbi:MAG: YlmC/YmxH family sporulation protein [Clostridia bacterium]|nr:YlmC/YmxH family sporulation protein [Clostridia bacterium]
MTLSELRQKDVINTRDGRSLGRVMDLEFCACDGRINALVVPGEFRFAHMLRGERAGIVIPWENICKIGDDVILVDVQDICS